MQEMSGERGKLRKVRRKTFPRRRKALGIVHPMCSEELIFMVHYDYLIIGGGIAGVTAAETIREKKPLASIGIISDEPHILYSRVLLPSYLKKKIAREQVFLRSTEDFTKKNIDLHLAEEVAEVDTERRVVHLATGTSYNFDKLLIAAGGRVKSWGNPQEQEYIYRLQTIDDADRLFKSLPSIRHPLVVGSSFISLEFLEIFFLNNIIPILLSRDAYCFGNMLEERGGEIMRNNLERHGIQAYFNESIKEIRKSSGEIRVQTQRLQEISCDSFAIGIGVDRNIGFLKSSGLAFGETGIKTDEFLQTNKEGIFAAGDIAEFFDRTKNKHHIAGNWTIAFLQGKRAGLNMAGEPAPFVHVSAYSITNLGFQITAIGLASENAEDIVRIDREKEQYERLILSEGIIIGAALINRFQDKAHITKLIETRTPIAEYGAKLESFAFDIQNIPVLS